MLALDVQTSSDKKLYINEIVVRYHVCNETTGGIDIQNINVLRKGASRVVHFDQAALQEIVAKGFDDLTPVFLGISFFKDPLSAMGVK